jgi:hypothetical protein
LPVPTVKKVASQGEFSHGLKSTQMKKEQGGNEYLHATAIVLVAVVTLWMVPTVAAQTIPTVALWKNVMLYKHFIK